MVRLFVHELSDLILSFEMKDQSKSTAQAVFDTATQVKEKVVGAVQGAYDSVAGKK